MANILIVDDEQSYRQLLTLVFESDGHTVRTAMNGRLAIESLNESPADIIISDVRMPDMGGIEMLRELRETMPDIGVIFVTAVKEVDTAREAFKLGAGVGGPYSYHHDFSFGIALPLEVQGFYLGNLLLNRAELSGRAFVSTIGVQAAEVTSVVLAL